MGVAHLHTTLQGAALLGSVDALHSSFPDDADQEYITQGIHVHTWYDYYGFIVIIEKLILDKLGLSVINTL